MRDRRIKLSASLEVLEGRRLRSGGTYSVDGSSNNVSHPEWGAVNQPLLRIAPSAYSNGLSTPGGADRLSARYLSNTLMQHHGDDIFNARHMSAFAYAWGQFIDHDLDLTSDAKPGQPFPIKVPGGDNYFDPFFDGGRTIGLNRSESVPGTGITTPLEHPNSISGFLDGSVVYGSDPVRAAALRSFTGGLLKTSAGNLMPFNTTRLPNDTAGGDPTKYFLGGDVRANENAEMTAVNTLMVREHNRLAGYLAGQHPSWTDEQLYQEARKLTIAEIQMITYDEYLPAMMGSNAMPKYKGYDANVNAGISDEFSTAAFRVGHSMLGNDVQFFDDNGNATADDLHLADVFFKPQILQENGVDSLLKYLNSVDCEEVDTAMVDGVRNFLFGPPGSGGLDLAALDIQRGRDHGLADYNTERAALGLGKITSFSQITSSRVLQQSLKSFYKTVDNVDLFVAGLSEDHVAGSSLGPTFQAILVDQFTRTRAGDRFWYQNNLTADEMAIIRGTTLTKVIANNTPLRNMQPNSFIFDVQISGTVFTDSNLNGRFDRDERPLAGQIVRLVDDEGTVVGRTYTNAKGRYNFSSVQVGNYTTTVTVPDHLVLTNPEYPVIAVTRGMLVGGQDYGMAGRLIKLPESPIGTDPITPQVSGKPAGDSTGSTGGRVIQAAVLQGSTTDRFVAQILFSGRTILA